MGLEYIVQPQVFLGGLTALGPGIQGLTEQYPLLTTYYSWTSTASVNTSSFPIPIAVGSIYNGPRKESSFIVSVGGVIQSPTEYTVDSILRTITFSSVVSAGIEFAATQLATAAPSSQNFNFLKSVSAEFTTLSTVNGSFNNLVVTNLTALSTTVNVIDIRVSEVSGFRATGNVDVFGNVNVTNNITLTGNLVATNITSTSLTSTNITSTNLTSTLITTNILSAREINLVHTPANDGVDPILDIGETTTDGFSGIRVRYEENTNRLLVQTVDPTVVNNSVIIDRATGQVGISAIPNQALTVAGNISATGAIKAVNTWPNSSYFILTANTPTVASSTGLVFFPLASGGEITLQPNLIYRVDMTPSLSTTYVSTAYNLTYSLSGNNIFTVLEGYGLNLGNSTDPYAANFKNLGTGNAFHFVTTSNANIFNSGTFNFILSSSSTTTILMTGVTTNVSALSRKASSRWTADVIGRV